MTVPGTICIPKSPAPWKVEHFTRGVPLGKKRCECGRLYSINDRHIRCRRCREGRDTTCQLCGREFIADRESVKFCGYVCSNKARRARA